MVPIQSSGCIAARIRSKQLEFPEHCEGGHRDGEERIETELPIWVMFSIKPFMSLVLLLENCVLNDKIKMKINSLMVLSLLSAMRC